MIIIDHMFVILKIVQKALPGPMSSKDTREYTMMTEILFVMFVKKSFCAAIIWANICWFIPSRAQKQRLAR